MALGVRSKPQLAPMKSFVQPQPPKIKSAWGTGKSKRFFQPWFFGASTYCVGWHAGVWCLALLPRREIRNLIWRRPLGSHSEPRRRSQRRLTPRHV